jgi:hypothetical protein
MRRTGSRRGAAGHSAAVAAARVGAKVNLMERYGYFGGDVTGGYVLLIPTLNWRTYSMNRGPSGRVVYPSDKNAPDSYIGPALEYVGRDVPLHCLRGMSLMEGALTTVIPDPHTRSVPCI